jgi:2'-5' RNA ligase
MPHVTLLYPFYPRENFDAVETVLRNACRAIEPFELRLAELRHFHHGRARYTLWLAPQPGEAVVQLQAALEMAVPDCNETSGYPAGFTPHLSVGQVRGHERLAALKVDLQANWQPLSFPVRHVNLIRRNQPPDDVFRVDRRISLG